MVSVKWSDSVLQDLEGLDKIISKRIVEKVGWLEQNFIDITPERLHRDLRDLYKLRVGDYRAIYSVSRDLITIEAIGHRRDIYK